MSEVRRVKVNRTRVTLREFIELKFDLLEKARELASSTLEHRLDIIEREVKNNSSFRYKLVGAAVVLSFFSGIIGGIIGHYLK